jgi:hypothetical protein
MVTLEQRYKAKRNASLNKPNHTMQPMAIGPSKMEDDSNGRRVRQKRWAVCRSMSMSMSMRQGILQRLLTLPGIVAILVVAGVGFIGYQVGQTRSNMEELSQNSNNNNMDRSFPPLPTTFVKKSRGKNMSEGVNQRTSLVEKMRMRQSRSRIPEAMNKTLATTKGVKKGRHEPLPEHVDNWENVGWLLPGIAKTFYLGTGAGESFGPPLTLPAPILVVGMPKTGTTSIRDFFRCNGHNASHWKCATDTMTMGDPGSLRKKALKGKYCAQVIKDNIASNRPALQGTGNYQVYAQMDVELPDVAVTQGVLPFACYMPQVNDLEKLSASYPKATFILNTRNASRWVHSLRTFLDFDEKLKKCDLKGFPAGTGDTDEEFEAFFHQHSQNIRDFVKKHPSHKLIEVDIEDPNAGHILADAFGQSPECWVKRNAGGKKATAGAYTRGGRTGTTQGGRPMLPGIPGGFLDNPNTMIRSRARDRAQAALANRTDANGNHIRTTNVALNEQIQKELDLMAKERAGN